MSTDTSKSPDKGSERPWLTQEVDEDFEKFYNEQIRPHLAEGLDPLTKTGFIQMCEAGWKARGYYAALASVPRLEGTPYKFTDLTPSKEDYKTAWQMQHPNAMGANWPGIPGNPYPPLADHLCCKRLLEEARAEVERLTDLVRYQRHELHTENLISDDEFVALVADSDSGNRVARLESYDALRKKAEAALATTIEEQRGQIINWEEREAAVCPEDQTFEETIIVLRAAIATAEEAGVRKALAIAGSPDFPRAPEGTLQNAFNAGLREYHTRILALLSGEGTK